MDKFLNWLENSFAPKMNVVNNNIWVITIKDSVMQILPFILLGSVFCVLSVVEDFFSLPISFDGLFGWTMGMVAVLVAFLIPFNFCEKRKLRKQRLIAGCAGLILFFISIQPQLVIEGAAGFGPSAFGAGGMFCAIFTGVVTSLVFRLFGSFSLFSDESVVPDFVRQWFDALLPIACVIVLGFVCTDVFGINMYSVVTGIFMPFSSFLNTWYGFIFFNFLNCFIYSMGISAWVLTPVEQPVKLAAIAANIAMAAAGTATAANLNMFTETLIYTCYLWWGGIGCTFPLVIMLMRSKSKQLSSLGKACLAPAICQINEPVVFGCIAWNPIMMIPMWIIGVVLPAVCWLGCKVLQFAPISTIQFDFWYCPFPISTWFSSGGSIIAVLFAIVLMLLAGLIWYPFFKVYEKQCLAKEAE